MEEQEINHSTTEINPDLEQLNSDVLAIKHEIQKVIVGQDDMIQLLIAGLFVGGHVLIEGVPGIAKTLTVNLLSKTLNLDFKRIQFTPDIMPADVTGTSVYNPKSMEFDFKKGPIFSNIILIDEINRSPAKTQAALFEVMEEQQVSIDGHTHKMAQPFMVLATQNPIEQEGTYKLPEAQQDRFIFKIKINYPSLEEEILILNRFQNDFNQKIVETVKPVLNKEAIFKNRLLIEQVYVKEEIIKYIAQIIHYTRNTKDLFLGASTRASMSIIKTSKALAAMSGRNFVTPDDVHHVLYPVLNHRVILSAEKEMEGFDVKNILEDIVKKIEVPR